MKRREFLTASAGLLGGLLLGVSISRVMRSTKPVASADVVIVGGGVGGSTVARLVSPHLKTLVVEQRGLYIVGPAKEDILLGLADAGEYSVVRIGVFEATAYGLDPGNRLLYTTAGPIAYRYLVLAMGVRIAYEEVKIRGRPRFINPYDDASVLANAASLRETRGDVVIAHPGLPYRCTSAPYEIAFLVKALSNPRRLVVVSGVKGIPVGFENHVSSLGDVVMKLMEEKGIEFIGGSEVVEVREGSVLLDTGETLRYDMLIWTPPHRGWPWLVEAGVAREDLYGYVKVDNDFKTRWDDVYAIGDVIWHVVKTGWAAYYEALVAASRILQDAGLPAESPGFLYSEDSIRLEPHLAIRGAKKWWPIYGEVFWREVEGPDGNAATAKYAWMQSMKELVTL